MNKEGLIEEKKIEKDATETGKILCNVDVREQCVPHYEIDLPFNVLTTLGLMEDDTINFIEENGRVYLEKVKEV